MNIYPGGAIAVIDHSDVTLHGTIFTRNKGVSLFERLSDITSDCQTFGKYSQLELTISFTKLGAIVTVPLGLWMFERPGEL